MRYLPTKSEANTETVGDSDDVQPSPHVMTVDIAFEPLNVMKGLSAGTVTFSLYIQFGTRQCCQMWFAF